MHHGSIIYELLLLQHLVWFLSLSWRNELQNVTFLSRTGQEHLYTALFLLKGLSHFDESLPAAQPQQGKKPAAVYHPSASSAF